MNLRKRWRTIFGVFVLSILCFTSCDNFLQGDDVKKDITDAIEYNNAKSYIIKFKADKESGVIKTPAGEEISKKVTDTFTIKFDPEDDHKFLKWEAIISGADKDESASAYISFEDTTSLETKVTFKKAADSIIIRPVCPERLSVTKFNMSNEAEEYPRDSSIILTFNRKIPEACSDAFSISIPGLEEDKAWTDYFLPAEINGKEVTFRTKYTQTHSEADLIPVLQNASKAITISLNAKKLWYVNNEYSQDININLDKDISYKYIVNSATSKKTTIKFTSENEQCSLRVNDIVWNGQSISSNVGDSIALRCKPMEGWCFCGWKFTRTYIENDQQKTEQIPASSLADINLKLEYEEGSNQYGFDAETKIAQAKLIVNNYIEGTITVSPVMYESLSVTFNMADAEKLYPRNNSIELTFNHPVMEECLDKITVRIPGLPQGASASDYFEPAAINGNKIILKAKTGEGRAADMIPVAVNGSLGITVIVPAGEVYYQAQTQDETYKVGLYSEKVFTYTVNTETVNKTKIKLHVEPEFRDFSTLRVGEEVYSENEKDYSVGKSFALNFKITDAYKFYGWYVVHTYTDSQGAEQIRTITLPDEASLLEELNLSVAYTDGNVSQPVFTVEKSIAGHIIIQPYVVKIATASINIDGEHGTFTPGKGTNVYKVGVKNHIEFDAASDYAFLRWQVVNATTNEELPLQDSLAEGYKHGNTWFRFTNAGYNKTDFELIRVPEEEDNINFVIKPIVVQRPRIISSSPSYDPQGAFKNTTVQVMFDSNMDENSIYFDENERNSIFLTNQQAEFLYTDGKCYCYKIGQQKFFKNINITNSRNDESFNIYYGIPIFENPRTLSIPIDTTKTLPTGARISVEIQEGFYKEGNKDVSLTRAQIWQYLVSDKNDDVTPTIDSIVVKSTNLTIPALVAKTEAPDFTSTAVTALPYFGGGKFDLTLNVHDNTAVDSTFYVYYQKSGSSVTRRLNINYTNTYGAYANHEGECELKGLEDGVYGIYFEIKDTSGKSIVSPDSGKYYCVIDKTAPNVAAPTVTDIEDSATSLNLAWNPNSVVDYKNATILYRKWGTNDEYVSASQEPFSKGTNSCTLTGLSAGTHYEIVAKYKDYAGNVNEVAVPEGAYTRPATPQSVEITTETGHDAILTLTKPEAGNFTTFIIRAKFAEENAEFSSQQMVVEKDNISENGTAVVTLDRGFIGLLSYSGYRYAFEVRAYDEESDKTSIPYYTSGTNLPVFATKPSAMTWTPNFDSNTTEGTVTITHKGGMIISGYYVYCSENQDYSGDSPVTQVKHVTQNLNLANHSVTFEDLTPGKRYYIKSYCYLDSETNRSDLTEGIAYTKPMPVTNLAYTPGTNTSLYLTWNAPTLGNHDSYTIMYKKSSYTNWTQTNFSSVNVPKGDSNEVSAVLDGLEGGIKYDIKVAACVTSDNGTKVNSDPIEIKNCQLCPNPVQNFAATKLTDRSFKVSWAKPDGAANNYNGYKLYYSKTLEGLDTATPILITDKNTTEYTAENLDYKALYYLKMETYLGTADDNARLKTFTAPIGCSLALENVKNLTATPVSTSKITLNWTNPTEAYDGIQVYNGNVLYDEPAKTVTSLDIDGLAVNTEYTFSVIIYRNENGSQLKATTPITSCTLSSQVSGLTTTINNPKSVTLNWTNPSSTTWNKINIYVNDECVQQITSSSVSSYTCAIEEGGKSCNIKIQTSNKQNVVNTINTAQNQKSLRTPPEPVTNLTCTELTNSTATITWTKPQGYYSNYKVYYKENFSSSWVCSNSNVSSSATQATISGLTAGTAYYFKVESVISGISNIGNTSSTETSDKYQTKPNEPKDFAYKSNTDNSLSFEWKKPAGYFVNYRLYYKKSSESTFQNTVISSSSTTCTISGLASATTYDVYLVTYAASGESSRTSTITKTTKLDAPTNFKVEPSGTGTKVSWTASTGSPSDYLLYYKKTSDSYYSYKTITGTSYTFSNTALSNGIAYYFYVKARKTVNSEDLTANTVTKTFYTPPAKVNADISLYSDDTMKTVVISWTNPRSRTDIEGYNVYLGTNTTKSATVTSFTAGGLATAAVTIPNYYRGQSYTFRIEPYHKKNSGVESHGPETSGSIQVGSGLLVLNGSEIYYAGMTTVLSSNKTITNHTTDGGSFVNGRNITLSKYSIGTCEVSNALWRAVTGDTNTSNNYLPKTNISWQQAIAFCNKLSAMQGLEPCYEISGYENYDWKNFNMSNVPTTSDSRWYGCKQNLKNNGYHLPTCAQWEFAARGGDPSKTEFFYGVSGVDDWAKMPQYVVYGASSASYVGSKLPNRLGLYDMIGNVWEMLTDWNNEWPAGTFTDPYCEVRYHGTGTGEWVSNTGQAIPYNSSKIIIYRAGGYYGDNENLSAPSNLNLRVYATYQTAYVPNYVSEFYAPTADATTGFRLCRNVTY